MVRGYSLNLCSDSMLMIKRIVLHEMSVTVRVSFPASAYCMVMKALWLVVVLVKQLSLGVGEVGVICVRE